MFMLRFERLERLTIGPHTCTHIEHHSEMIIDAAYANKGYWLGRVSSLSTDYGERKPWQSQEVPVVWVIVISINNSTADLHEQ